MAWFQSIPQVANFGHICYQLMLGQHVITTHTSSFTPMHHSVLYTHTHSSFQRRTTKRQSPLIAKIPWRPTGRERKFLQPSLILSPFSSKNPRERLKKKERKGKQQTQDFRGIYREPIHTTMRFLILYSFTHYLFSFDLNLN